MVVRHTIAALLLILCLGGIAQAADVEVTPRLPFSAVVSISDWTDLTSTGVVLHKLTWATSGTVTGGACALQQSPDKVNSITTLISAQTVTASGGPTSWTYANANFVRINCTTPITGSGNVRITYDGVNPKPTTDVNGTPLSAITDPCDGLVPAAPINAIVASTTLVKIVTKSTGKKNYGCGLMVINDSTTTIAHFSLIEGTQTTNPCDTGAVAVVGSTTAGNGVPIAINAGGFFWSRTLTGTAVTQDWCIQNDGSASLKVVLAGIQQ
jgi:hypothetical protein